MHKHLKKVAVVLPILAILFVVGCGIQPSHPNQIDAFDGATFDDLLLAQGALLSLRAHVSVTYPKFAPLFNQAGAAYNGAVAAYTSFRSQPATEAEVSVAIANLTVAVIALESAFQAEMRVSPNDVARLRVRALRLRSTAKGVAVSTILTELQIAAAVARAVPPASPYARLAQIVIESTSGALAAQASASGKPIDLAMLKAIKPI